jgi:hypothetical protein
LAAKQQIAHTSADPVSLVAVVFELGDDISGQLLGFHVRGTTKGFRVDRIE